MTNPSTPAVGQTVRASQPGGPEFVGRVVGPDPLLTDFLRIQWDAKDGRGVLEARVHASRCEEVSR